LIPACEVLYQEPGKENQKVGFDTVKEAMHYLFSLDREGEEDIDSPYDIISTTLDSGRGGIYDLAFVVEKGFYPERSFVVSTQKVRTAVCIDGIRADRHLPGFSEALCALLSVRDNKKFRTTVSRESLEVDEEYLTVSKLCATALFDHVRNEVRRISAIEGHPLLQASTAGRWVYRSLVGQSNSETRKTLRLLYEDLPLVVVERTNRDEGVPEERTLLSLNEVRALPQLWTIEWRTVDYLGVISRDLGRELNISNFLGTLVPDLYDSRMDTIVVDAQAFSSDLIDSHSIVVAEFSKRHQRTVLRWVPRGHAPDWKSPANTLTLGDVHRFGSVLI
jgi:hypothetical protein